jgi:hypothetical protein
MDKELEYKDALAPFEEIIEQVYSPKDQDLWRWCHNPINECDFAVQAENPINVPNINIEEATFEEKVDFIERYALSAYTSPENAIAAYNEVREIRVSRRGEQAGLKFDEQKGKHIQPIHVTPEHGVSDTPSGEHGHVNILMYKGVKPEDMVEGAPTPIVKPDSQGNKDDENAL